MDKLFNFHWFGGPEGLPDPAVNPNGGAPLNKPTNFANDNHIITMIAMVVLVFILSILIYAAVKRQKADKAPSAGILMVETMIMGADSFASETHSNRFDKANPYLISLFTFFLLGNMISMLGFVPIGSSLAAIFAATAITWFTTIGIGIAYNKFKYLLKLINPLEIAGTVSPLISLTFRMYGNIIGGLVLITLFGLFLDNIWAGWIGATLGSPASQLNPLGALLLPGFNLYFDIFDSLIQAFVFMILTMSYWFQASEVDAKEKHKEKIKEWKKEVLKNKNKLETSALTDNQNQEAAAVAA
ncbi:F0F1 ATP synthase subunit A [[Mycoplasma] falconis]|uniref:F0F1 ATP synthase subunit A n=1 Tax=[Mycoplasma] falconis TaxID=92403 RepID=A0A501XC69_9BACT|nr:F0F1 ATP synthase subunit A [[Mycoplasma] falconis]TPE58102.1 F0F1 ATP synthase subunit A [[Mycoplasma] falconis]